MSVNIYTAAGLKKVAGSGFMDAELNENSNNGVKNSVLKEKFDEHDGAIAQINTDLSNLSIKYDDTDDYIYCRVNGNWVRWRKANFQASVVIYDAGYENPSYAFYSGVAAGSITRNAETIQFTRNSNQSQYWARTSASIDFTDITQLTIDTDSSSGPGILMIIGTQQSPIQWLEVKDAGVHTFGVSGISGSYPITVYLHNGATAAYCTLVLKRIILS